MEEVIENKKTTVEDCCRLYQVINRKVTGDCYRATENRKHGNIIKKHTVMSKSITSIEESKKGYTGDALALRGDEGRDKLR